MNLHIANDEKFIDGFITNESRYTETNNVYLVVKIYGDVKHVKSDKVIFVKNDLHSLKSEIRNQQNIEKIYFHSLTSLFADIIKIYKGKYKLIWLLFGAEVFMLNAVRKKLILSSTRNVLTKIFDDWFKFSLHPLKLRRDLINYNHYGGIKQDHDKKIKEAISHIDYIGHFIPSDIKHFILKINPDIKWIEWNYFARDQTKPPILKVKKQNNILLGHSGSEFNNHIDGIKFLSKIQSEFKVLTPLSYGGRKKYVDYVCKAGFKHLKSRFVPQLNFVPPNEYYRNIATTKAAVFFNLRSQAAGNIISLLEFNIPVFMHSSSNLYQFFKHHEVRVFEISEFKNFIKNGLTDKDKELVSINRNKVENIFGDLAMKKKYSNLLNI